MHDRCGLVNPIGSRAGPSPKGPLPFARCRCAKKTRGFIERGIVDPDALTWDGDFAHRIDDFAEAHLDEALAAVDEAAEYPKRPGRPSPAAVHRDVPLAPYRRDGRSLVDVLLDNEAVRRILRE